MCVQTLQDKTATCEAVMEGAVFFVIIVAALLLGERTIARWHVR